MNQVLKPYPAYKESGWSWLGEVPSHWELSPRFSVFREKKQKNIGMKESKVLSLSYGRIIVKPPEKLHGLVPESFETYQVVEPGDIIIRSTDLQNDWNSLRVGLVKDRGIITSAYMCLKVNGHLNGDYTHLLLHAYDLKKFFYGMGSGLRQNLDFSDFKRMLVLIPPIEEQTQIVHFINWLDHNVNRYIRAKRRLIELLNEQKQAIIHQAVTRGLEPNVRLKPSGVEWLGDVPEHWEVVRSKRTFAIRTELARPNDIQLSATQAYGVIPQVEYEQKVGRRIVKIFRHLEKRRHVEIDDFVISMRSFQGGLERAWATGCIRSSYVVLRSAIRVDVGYFSYVFKSADYIKALQATANFIRDGQDLNFDNFCAVDLPFPPIEEQRQIADALDKALADTAARADRSEREIALLHEYRTRLIADVVTGKLDVRSVDLSELVEAQVLEGLEESDVFTGEEITEEAELELIEEAADADD